MQLTISLPDMISDERISEFIKKMEIFFSEEGIPVEIKQDFSSDDPWDNLNIDEIAVDTGIEDFAENHDRAKSGFRHSTNSRQIQNKEGHYADNRSD